MQKQIKALFIAAALLIPATLPTFAQDKMKDKMEDQDKMKDKKMTSHKMKMKGKKHKMSKMHKSGKKMDGPMEEKKP